MDLNAFPYGPWPPEQIQTTVLAWSGFKATCRASKDDREPWEQKVCCVLRRKYTPLQDIPPIKSSGLLNTCFFPSFVGTLSVVATTNATRSCRSTRMDRFLHFEIRNLYYIITWSPTNGTMLCGRSLGRVCGLKSDKGLFVPHVLKLWVGLFFQIYTKVCWWQPPIFYVKSEFSRLENRNSFFNDHVCRAKTLLYDHKWLVCQHVLPGMAWFFQNSKLYHSIHSSALRWWPILFHDFRQDLGLKVTDLFENFEEEPIASASIAQVGHHIRPPSVRHVR